MTTVVTSPAGSGARPAQAERGLPGPRFHGRRRWLTTGAVTVIALAIGTLLVATDLQARAQIRTDDVSLTAAVHQLTVVRQALTGAEQRLARARSARRVENRSFDSVQTTLSATQAALAHDEAGIYFQGVDLGQLDTCLSTVEQALNQLAVGQTAGGLASLRASSSSCAVLDEVA